MARRKESALLDNYNDKINFHLDDIDDSARVVELINKQIKRITDLIGLIYNKQGMDPVRKRQDLDHYWAQIFQLKEDLGIARHEYDLALSYHEEFMYKGH